MWRLWAKGFGIRSWWFWFRREAFPVWIVLHVLPARVIYWTFIITYSYAMDAPSAEFTRIHEAMCRRYRIEP